MRVELKLWMFSLGTSAECRFITYECHWVNVDMIYAINAAFQSAWWKHGELGLTRVFESNSSRCRGLCREIFSGGEIGVAPTFLVFEVSHQRMLRHGFYLLIETLGFTMPFP